MFCYIFHGRFQCIYSYISWKLYWKARSSTNRLLGRVPRYLAISSTARKKSQSHFSQFFKDDIKIWWNVKIDGGEGFGTGSLVIKGRSHAKHVTILNSQPLWTPFKMNTLWLYIRVYLTFIEHFVALGKAKYHHWPLYISRKVRSWPLSVTFTSHLDLETSWKIWA